MNSDVGIATLAARVVMVLAMYLLLRTFSRWAWVYALLRLPSTIAHELSHLLVGLIFRARPVGVSLWPRRVEGTNRYILGHVAFGNLNWWKTLPVATAPLLLMFPLGCWLVVTSLSGAHSQSVNLVYCFGAMQCFMGCWPSPEDWALARTSLYALIGLGVVVVVGYLMLRR